MNTLSYKTGYWASVSITVLFIAWIFCFTGIAITSPIFQWTNLPDYLAFVRTNSQIFQNVAKFCMLIFGPAYVVLINSYHNQVSRDKKILTGLSLWFGIAFAILSSLHYFVQLSTVRLAVEQGNTSGLEHFVQANPLSVMTSIDMAGWTLFLGLSSFFIFPVFRGDRLNRIIRYTFAFNGISCILAGVGYMLQIDVLTFIFINMGVGGALLIVAIASAKLFKRMLA